MTRAPLRLTAAVFVSIIAVGTRLTAESPAGAPSTADAMVGAWILNKDLSDKPPERPDGQGDRGSGGRGGRGGGRFGGGGSGRSGGGMGRGRATGDDQDRQHRMAAMREVMAAPDRLTITRSDAMIILTSEDGRTTRLMTDGKSVKDDATRIERKTHWNGDKLVSEISGVGRGKITETYLSDAERHRLTITLVLENARTQDGRPRSVTRVYDAEPR